MEFIFGKDIGVEPEKWDSDEPTVNRDNFADFVIRSFQVAQQDLRRHQILFRWCELKTGVKPKEIFDNFFENGGWEVLTDKEKETIITAFRNTPQHKRIENSLDINPNNKIKAQIRSMYTMGEMPDKDMCELLGVNAKLSELSFSDLISSMKNIRNE